jgi:hydrogenase nickel incorporation protein HypB
MHRTKVRVVEDVLDANNTIARANRDDFDRHGVPVVQLNTDGGFGGECHLDANMVRSAIPALPLQDIDLLVIENVGNLVCPAEFRVGEDARIMVCSVTEGEDKPLKYPLMFRACELVIINKIDLLEHLEFDVDLLEAHLDAVHPGVERIRASARSGEGVDAVRDWLVATTERASAIA